MDGADPGPQASGYVQPVDSLLEERIAARHFLIVAPVVGRFGLLHDRDEVSEHQFSDDAAGQESAKLDTKRFVMIVFTHQHHATAPSARFDDGLIVIEVGKRRLFHQNVLPHFQRAQNQFEMIARRHRDHHGVYRGVTKRGVVALVVSHACESTLILGCAFRVTTRIATYDVGTHLLQVPTVYAGDESASEEADVNRFQPAAPSQPWEPAGQNRAIALKGLQFRVVVNTALQATPIQSRHGTR